MNIRIIFTSGGGGHDDRGDRQKKDLLETRVKEMAE